ncbi:dimethyladenosine transferase 2, mitochondrial [Dendroctonus ponderosae]
MAWKLCFRKTLPARFNACFLCDSAPALENCKTPLTEGKADKPPKAPKLDYKGREKHLQEISKFFRQHPSIGAYQNVLPAKIVQSKTYKNPEYVYLVNPQVADDIAKYVFQSIQSKNHIVAESNPGLGLISQSLIKLGIRSVRLYELNPEFHEYLEKTFQSSQSKFKHELFKKDFFSLWRYNFIDNGDQGQRVTDILKGLPKKSWTDGPVATVVGTMTRNIFLRYLVKSIVLQREIATYGRVDLFLITYEKYWNIFNKPSQISRGTQKAWGILTNIFLEAELIKEYPREFFLPWEISSAKKRGVNKSDSRNMYLIKVTMKKEFSLHADHFVPFFCFAMNLYAKGSSSIIATCEKWVPGCGEYLLVPRLTHTSYFEDMNVFTQFKDLTTEQVFGVYREMQSHPNYQSSPFMDMIEQEWLKTETIETTLYDAHSKAAQ